MSRDKGNVAILAGGASLALAGRFSGRVVSVLGNILAARILGPAIFGVYSIGLTIFRLVELIAPLGFDMGIIRYGSMHYATNTGKFRGLVQKALKGTFLFGLFVGLVFFINASWIATTIFNKPNVSVVLRYFSFAFPLAGLLVVLAAVTRLTFDMKYSVLLQDLGQPLLGLFLLIVFFLTGARLRGVLLADLLSYGVITFLGIYFLVKLFPGVLLKVTADLTDEGFLSYSIFSSLTTIANTLVFWVDRLLVGYFLSASETGIYQAASQISVLFAVVLASFSRIVTPMLANFHHQGQKKDMEEIYRVSTKWGIYISTPFLLVMLLSPSEILSVTYGEEYASGALVILILLSGQLFNLITGPVGPLLVATGHQKFTFIISGLALVINVFLNVATVPVWGLVGAALSTSISLLFLYTVELFAAKRMLGLWPYDLRYWKGILSGFFAFGGAALLGHAGTLSALPLVITQTLICMIVFFGTLLIFKLEKEDLELVKLLQNVFKSK